MKIEDRLKMYVDLQDKLDENVAKEKESIVKTAAKLIRNEITNERYSPMATSTERLGTKKNCHFRKIKRVSQ